MNLVSGAFWGSNPHDELAWLRANDPVHFDEANGIWGIARYDDVKAISKNSEVFSNAEGHRPDQPPVPMMVDMDDPDHIRRRRLVSEGFTPQRVRAQEAIVRVVADEVIDRVCEMGRCDFVSDVAAWVPLTIIGKALGFEEADWPRLLEISDDLMRGLGNDDPAALERTASSAMDFTVYVEQVIEDRQARRESDLVSTLVHAEIDGDRLEHDELIYELLLLLVGGDETTRHVMTGGLFQLLTNHHCWEELHADRSLLPGAVEEMLRWVSPVRNMARSATRDVELGGRQILEGQKVLLLYPSANRDEHHFDNPMQFDIHRTPNDHVAFGFGTHFCLGASLARLELTVFFDRLLDRLPDLQLLTPDEPAYRPANLVSGYETMPVVFTPTPRPGARR